LAAEAAYDLNTFAGKTVGETEQDLRRRTLRLVKNRRKPQQLLSYKTIMLVVAVLAACVTMIYSRVVLTELTEEANGYQQKLTVLNAEYIRLSGELEAASSIKTLEETAESDLGLSKIESSQVQYVNLTSEDHIVVADEKGLGWLGTLWGSFTALFEEYNPF